MTSMRWRLLTTPSRTRLWVAILEIRRQLKVCIVWGSIFFPHLHVGVLAGSQHSRKSLCLSLMMNKSLGVQFWCWLRHMVMIGYDV